MKRIIALLIVMMMIGCTQPLVPNTPKTGSSPDVVKFTGELKKFNNMDEIVDYLQKTSEISFNDDIMLTKSASFSAPTMDMAVAESGPRTSGNDYSTTNVQYESVDEADFVKNDGEYIYMISDNELIIIDAKSPQDSKIISQTEISKERDYRGPQAKEMFVYNNKLALFVEESEETFYIQKYDIEPIPSYRQNTKVILFDLSDKTNPKIEKEIKVSGRYYQSRLVDDMIYLVSQEDTGHYSRPIIPFVKTANIIRPDVYYFDNPESSYQYNTIASINMSNNELVEAKTFMLGYSNTLMVSKNNIFIAYKKNLNSFWRFNNKYEKERFYDVIVPLLQGDIASKINNIILVETDQGQEWEQISEAFANFYKKLYEDSDAQKEYEPMLENIVNALEEYDTKKAIKNAKTIIQKINIGDGKIDYQAKGEINGDLLNQFSMDENNGYLRAASTVTVWNKKRIQYSNVYVLDKDMKTIGEVNNIAPDERIYSTRFMGDKLYMVTFKQTDPLFVIDLSIPTSPKIAGKLKIPGFSSYLHPYDKNTIIGIGKDGDEDGVLGGIKIALFDVSDINKPKELDQYVIGDQGSNSAILQDHKAFLLSGDRLYLPVTEVTKREKLSAYRFSNTIWNGVYVFDLSRKEFNKVGKIEHGSQKSDYWRWYDENMVSRSLFIGKGLYTISSKYVKVNDLDSLENLNQIILPYSELRYY